jgi:hypothetical protein
MAGDTAESSNAQEAPSSSGSTDIFSDKFSPWILNLGFIFALIIAAICFAFSARYLDTYLSITSNSVDTIIQVTTGQPVAMQLALGARLAVAKYSLSSCGVVAGLAFGFLGFALFLLGIKGTMDAGGSYDKSSVQLVAASPLFAASRPIGVPFSNARCIRSSW